MAHFEALLKQDGGKRNFGLKIAHKLTSDHINPKYYQKMNSGLVVQVCKLYKYLLVAFGIYSQYVQKIANNRSNCEISVKITSK